MKQQRNSLLENKISWSVCVWILIAQTLAGQDFSLIKKLKIGNIGDDKLSNVAYIAETQTWFIAGTSNSQQAEFSNNHGGYDTWCVALNDTTVLWQQVYGSAGNDLVKNVLQTPYGMLVIGANADTINQQFWGGNTDIWLMMLNPQTGAIVWQKTYGGSGDDVGIGALLRSDGSILIAATTTSADGQINNALGKEDIWLFAISENGEILEQKTLGGSNDDETAQLLQTSDQQIMLLASSRSEDGTFTNNIGSKDICMLALNENLDLLWVQNYGGTFAETAKSFCQTPDGGFAVVGETFSTDLPNYHNSGDFLLLKTDAQGNQQWIKAMGGSLSDIPAKIAVWNEQLVFVGASLSFDGDLPATHLSYDIVLGVVSAENGNLLQAYAWGGSRWDIPNDLFIQNDAQQILIVADSDSIDGDMVEGGKKDGNHEAWLLFLDAANSFISLNNNFSLQAYPNPANVGEIVRVPIENTAELSYQVVDIKGKVCVPLQQIPAGTGVIQLQFGLKNIYFIRFFTKNKFLNYLKVTVL
ncbi:MAG: T9SS type A sorting domain-containing protein [Chitinophagales bacterium]|nr:T9SS type A sorting domain-containing protein [Bacteroidota bacterium]MCB9043425.1 T9SS type A sorting domain-containing protein [Chitinophagales bacterium]